MAEKSSSLRILSIVSVGKQDVVKQTLASQPNMAVCGDLSIQECKLEFQWHFTNAIPTDQSVVLLSAMQATSMSLMSPFARSIKP